MTRNEFFKHELVSRDTIDVKKIYVDIAGDLVSGVLLSQVMFWHLPNKEGGTKLRVKKEGHLWLAKKRDDWWDECRVSPKQFDRSVKELEKRQCVKTKLFKFDGNPTKHVRMNWDDFLVIYDAVLNYGAGFVTWEGGKWILTKGEYRNCLLGNNEIDETGISLTEITTENTTETKTTNPPIREKDAQIGTSDGDFSNGVQNNPDSGDSDTDDSIHSKTDKIGGEIDEVHSNGYRCSSGDSNISVDQEKDIEKFAYVQAVVAHWNGLADRYKDKISQRTTRPAKLSSVDKFAKGKYRATLHWHTEGIPLDKICGALDTWVGAHIGSPVPLNYFANHDVPVVTDESEITPEACEWARKFMEEE